MTNEQIIEYLKPLYPTCEVRFNKFGFVELYDMGFLIEQFERNYLIYLIQTEQL